MSKSIKKSNDMPSKTRTFTMDDENHRRARIIAANKHIDNLSALFRYFIEKEWKENYSQYAAFDKSSNE